MKSKIYDWRLTRDADILEIDVRSDLDFFLVTETFRPSQGRMFSSCDDQLKYPSPDAAREYVEECVKLKLADGSQIAASHPPA